MREAGLDGRLLYEFRGSNPLARRILKLDERAIGTRRLLYWLPAQGEPRKLVHRIEAGALDHLPEVSGAVCQHPRTTLKRG